MTKRFFIGFLAIFAFMGSTFLDAQTETHAQVTVSDLPDAPISAMESSSSNMPLADAAENLRTPLRPLRANKHRLLNAYNLSLLTLAAGEAFDSWGTHRNMTHTKWICGFDSVWPTGGYAISTANQIIYNEEDVKNICGVSPTGMHPNYMFDVTQTNSFDEAGWAAAWKLTGNRNYTGVVAWNIGKDGAIALVAHYLHRKGGWRGKVGAAMNYWHGIEHVEAGIGNFRYVAHNRTPDKWVKNNPKGFNNWPGPYWWGKGNK